MTLAVAIVLGLLGLAGIVVGLGFLLLFSFALSVFDRTLKHDYAAQGREEVARLVEKIQNPLARRVIGKHLVAAGGAMAVSMVRGALQSRRRAGLYLAVAGAAALIASFYTNSWLPLVWKPV